MRAEERAALDRLWQGKDCVETPIGDLSKMIKASLRKTISKEGKVVLKKFIPAGTNRLWRLNAWAASGE